VWMQILHLLGADLYWIALVTLAAGVIWPKADATLLRPVRN
jgi:cytochrome c oxidase assembly protein subunit 15